MSTDAIVLLKADHKDVERLFKEFEKAGTTAQRKGQIAEEVSTLLTTHTHVENEVMYPQVRELLPDLEDDILESYEEHHVVDVLLEELAPLGPDDEAFEPKFTVLMENVRHHVKEEEDEWFPKVRDGLSRTQLQQIGASILALKGTTPSSLA
ncbi:MAG: hemerythrin domain-containing protein [Dermatophilaceae bacterium]